MRSRALGLAVVMVASCNLITGADELASTPITNEGSSGDGDPRAPDGGPHDPKTTTTPPDASASDVDAGTVVDAGPDANVDADAPTGPPNLVQNPGFEDPGEECGPPWSIFRSTLTRVSTARTGANACRVCKGSSTEPDFTINYSGSLDPSAKVGDRYRASAWVRLASGAISVAQIHLRVWNGSSGHSIGVSAPAMLDNTWKLVQVEGTVDEAPTRMDIYILSFGASTTDCFLVDDVSVVRLP